MVSKTVLHRLKTRRYERLETVKANCKERKRSRWKETSENFRGQKSAAKLRLRRCLALFCITVREENWTIHDYSFFCAFLIWMKSRKFCTEADLQKQAVVHHMRTRLDLKRTSRRWSSSDGACNPLEKEVPKKTTVEPVEQGKPFKGNLKTIPKPLSRGTVTCPWNFLDISEPLFQVCNGPTVAFPTSCPWPKSFVSTGFGPSSAGLLASFDL